jgi:hypothetical protein
LGLTALVEQSVSSAEEYQKRADNCRQEADAVQDLAEREALMCIAAQWEMLARYKAKTARQ